MLGLAIDNNAVAYRYVGRYRYRLYVFQAPYVRTRTCLLRLEHSGLLVNFSLSSYGNPVVIISKSGATTPREST